MEHFCKGKRLLPRGFKDKSYLKNLKGYYVPYWLFDCEAQADMSFHTTRTRCWSDSDYNYVETSHYLVQRGGEMTFYHVPVDGSVEMEDATTESIEPFDYKDVTAFNPAYLAGYETDKYDVDAKTAEKRAKERLYNTAESALRNTVVGYETVVPKRRQMDAQSGKISYALFPVWLFEMVYDKKKYQFAINGQTGKLTCDVPADRKKSLAWGGGVFAGVLGLSALALGLADQLASGTLLLAAILAAIVALIVVGCLRGQLKQAAQQSAAGGYIREGSFRLDVNADHFLYESTTKRKIENNTQKK